MEARDLSSNPRSSRKACIEVQVRNPSTPVGMTANKEILPQTRWEARANTHCGTCAICKHTFIIHTVHRTYAYIKKEKENLHFKQVSKFKKKKKVLLLLLRQEPPQSMNSGAKQSIQAALIGCVTLSK